MIPVAGEFGVGLVLIPVLAEFARGRGKRIQQKLRTQWDGPSTVRFLRHRDHTMPELTKQRYFATLATHSEIQRPTEAAELSDPVAADEIYRSASDWTRRHARHPAPGDLVATKNAIYGMHRNLLGLRVIGLVTSVIVAAILLGVAAADTFHDVALPPPLIIGCGLNMLAVALWAFTVNVGSVAAADDAYGLALLECLEPPAKRPGAGEPKPSTASSGPKKSAPKKAAPAKGLDAISDDAQTEGETA